MQQILQPTIIATREQTSISAAAGALAGAAASAVTAVAAPLLAVLSGAGAWTTLSGLGALLLGSGVLAGSGVSMGAVITGALVLLALGAALGAVFGLLFGALCLTTDFGLAIYSGLAYGILVFMPAYWGLLGGLPFAAAALLLPLLLLCTVIGLFYTLLRPTPYANQPRR